MCSDVSNGCRLPGQQVDDAGARPGRKAPGSKTDFDERATREIYVASEPQAKPHVLLTWRRTWLRPAPVTNVASNWHVSPSLFGGYGWRVPERACRVPNRFQLRQFFGDGRFITRSGVRELGGQEVPQ
jgi:hypothetical protein